MKRSISDLRNLIGSRHMNCISWTSAYGKGLTLLNQFRLIQCLVCKTLRSYKDLSQNAIQTRDTAHYTTTIENNYCLFTKRFYALIMSQMDRQIVRGIFLFTQALKPNVPVQQVFYNTKLPQMASYLQYQYVFASTL